MDIRFEIAKIFNDTEKWYTSEPELAEAVMNSIKGTALYMEGETPSDFKKICKETFFEINKMRSLEMAMALSKEYPGKKIAVHNFASATNPGGGVKSGSRAQEEAICRCSTLYPALATEKLAKKYYEFHWKRHDARYTDACIYTPDVKVIKTDSDFPERMPKKNWINVDIITCAAPNLRHTEVNDTELLNIHIKRARHMLSVAAHHGAEIIVLGAFGCGAFMNNPEIVASAYKKVLDEFDGVFERIAFAIYCTPRESRNYDAFMKILVN